MDENRDQRRTMMCHINHFHGSDELSSPTTHTHSGDDTREDLYICTSAGSSSSTSPQGLLDGKECSMCGDVGICKELFQCNRCLYRYQHLYCSRSYPNFGSQKWMCDWCLHLETKDPPKKQQRTRLKRKPSSGKSNGLEFVLQIALSVSEVGNREDRVGPQKSISAATNVLGGQVPKRQRCAHVAEKSKVVALDRWRQIAKNRLQLNPSKGIGRRYKLLADVLC